MEEIGFLVVGPSVVIRAETHITKKDISGLSLVKNNFKRALS